MIIDFHTHIFPERIAEQAISSLEEHAGIKAATDGTLEGLRDSMRQYGIDFSVVLPVITRTEQFESVNQYAAKINHTHNIISFGGIHPDHDHVTERLEYIKHLGLCGVKLHPDYQGAYIDDIRYLRILRECVRLKLVSVIHAGLDIGFPAPIHCPPDRALLMLREVLKDVTGDSGIVLAHVGGHLQWRLVEELLVGQNVYFDLAFCMNRIEPEQLMRIIRKHGSERILFATDSPWSNQGEMVSYLYSLPLTDAELDNIFYKNARRLLGM